MAELDNTDPKKKSLAESEGDYEEGAIVEDPENGGLKEEPDADRNSDAVTVQDSLAPTIGGTKKSCCYRFWNSIFRCFANDAIYGSFVGPHPVSFLCCCTPCKSCCKGTCKRPFLLASVATKAMWFIMLIVIMILSCFFIIPYTGNKKIETIADFFPCADHDPFKRRFVNDNLTRDCAAHGGYFMVYRNFFAFNFLLLISGLIMINVKSTGFNRKRAKMHHGFWMYKYLILFGLLLIAYLGIRVEEGGVFELILFCIGLLSALLFSLAEITLLLDVVEPIVINNRTSTSDWADCLYWTVCGLIIILDIGIIAALCNFFALYQYEISPTDSSYKSVCPLHLSIIIYAILLSIAILVMAVINRRKNQFPYTGVLQSTIVITYLLGVIWTALGSSPEIQARPHINVYEKYSKKRDGNLDTYFKAEGCAHGLSALITLIYYVFWNGPRSTTAPLSVLFNWILYNQAKKPEVPVLPDPDAKGSESFNEALEELKVWDDEKYSVRYSWTMFYVVMIFGSFSIMMGMANFSDPWASEWYASSYAALAVKIAISLALCLTFLITTTMPCRKIFPIPDDVPVETVMTIEGEHPSTEVGESKDPIAQSATEINSGPVAV